MVTEVTVTDVGARYKRAPAVTFTGGGGGTGAAARAVLDGAYGAGLDAAENLFWARQTLAGKQLVVQIVDAEDADPPADGGGS